MSEPMTEQRLALKLGQNHFYIDPQLATVVIALLVIGYVMLTSASIHLTDAKSMGINLKFALSQFIHITLGLVFAVIAASLPLSICRKYTPWLFLLGIILLILVFVPGIGAQVKGGTRWISISGFRLQASEFFKLFVILSMAGFISKNPDRIQGSIWGFFRANGWSAIPKALISPYGMLMICCALLMAQHNFGATVIVLTAVFGMFFLSGMRLGIFAIGFASLTALGSLLIMTSDYRRDRIIGYLDPFADPEGKGYQIIQALLSYVNGGWFGVGLGSGIQKMYYLPEAHTDFLFSVVGEELGFVGLLVIMILYVLLIRRIFKIAISAQRNQQEFAAVMTYGIGLWIGVQSFINMGVNMGMLPPKGLTLPLMSFGGTSMMVTLAALGLVFRVFHETVEQHQESPDFESEVMQ
ncbi:MAG: putative lipid II flippase FtsW [Gammaproteobacteria bacterium]|nr:putative lipid II flippase FtsW [Gammaproteobacteria bacterium]